jgi:NitT/TauT family transport system ATP-binding protein
MAAVATLDGISLAYGAGAERVAILEHLDLTLEAGQFVAVVGASGVGKSSLLRVLAGLVRPSAGRVALASAPTRLRRPIGLVFQEPRLLPWRRVRANVALGLEGLDLTRAEREARAHAALELVGLAGYEARWPYQLSGGQRQRVSLARALAVEPDLLLLDEPFGALDAITRAGLQDELLRVWERTRRTVLFVTHDIAEAVYLADRVVLLAGRPASLAGSWQVDERPRDRASIALLEVAETVRRQLARSMPSSDRPSPDYAI